MKQVNYILVNEKKSNQTVCDVMHRNMPNVGLCIVCDACQKFKVPGSKERTALKECLVRLLRRHPDAKLLGMSELDTSRTYAPVRVNPVMNALRREISDYYEDAEE